ncbi:hypothetical protein Hanom_Chr14g01261011 [Helianthus anomalus]
MPVNRSCDTTAANGTKREGGFVIWAYGQRFVAVIIDRTSAPATEPQRESVRGVQMCEIGSVGLCECETPVIGWRSFPEIRRPELEGKRGV